MGTQLVYTVVLPTGRQDEQGRDLVILVGQKLTRTAADSLVVLNPGAVVIRQEVDKVIEFKTS